MGTQSTWGQCTDAPEAPNMFLNISFILLLFRLSHGQDTGYNNSCLFETEGLNRDGPKELDCPRFVIESTDLIWNMYRDFETIETYLRQFMVDDWESLSVMGEYIRGMDELINFTRTMLTAFPDMQIHIIDVFCEGNDEDGYKTTMPCINTGTHLGYHPVFGPPTGKTVTWYQIPNCFIKNSDGQWKYTAEISIPDYLSLYSQLGVAPPEESWVMPTDDCDQLFDWDTGYINPDLVPYPYQNNRQK